MCLIRFDMGTYGADEIGETGGKVGGLGADSLGFNRLSDFY